MLDLPESFVRELLLKSRQHPKLGTYLLNQLTIAELHLDFRNKESPALTNYLRNLFTNYYDILKQLPVEELNYYIDSFNELGLNIFELGFGYRNRNLDIESRSIFEGYKNRHTSFCWKFIASSVNWHESYKSTHLKNLTYLTFSMRLLIKLKSYRILSTKYSCMNYNLRLDLLISKLNKKDYYNLLNISTTTLPSYKLCNLIDWLNLGKDETDFILSHCGTFPIDYRNYIFSKIEKGHPLSELEPLFDVPDMAIDAIAYCEKHDISLEDYRWLYERLGLRCSRVTLDILSSNNITKLIENYKLDYMSHTQPSFSFVKSVLDLYYGESFAENSLYELSQLNDSNIQYSYSKRSRLLALQKVEIDFLLGKHTLPDVDIDTLIMVQTCSKLNELLRKGIDLTPYFVLNLTVNEIAEMIDALAEEEKNTPYLVKETITKKYIEIA